VPPKPEPDFDRRVDEIARTLGYLPKATVRRVAIARVRAAG
jgi:hypothetical protein